MLASDTVLATDAVFASNAVFDSDNILLQLETRRLLVMQRLIDNTFLIVLCRLLYMTVNSNR